MRLLAALVLLAAPFAAAQSSSPVASASSSPAPSAVPRPTSPPPLPSGPPGPGTPSSTALPVAVQKGVTILYPNATAYWVKGSGQITAKWTPLLPYNKSAPFPVSQFELWIAHTNISMLGPGASPDISNNYRVIQRGLSPFSNNLSTTFPASVLSPVVPGPGFVTALISAGNASDIWAVSEEFEIKAAGAKPAPGAGGRRAALPSAAGITLLVGAAGVLAGTVLLV